MSQASLAVPLTMPSPCTVLGGRGFVGRHLVAQLRELGHTCWVPERDDPALFTRPLGLVFYCIGLTANFRAHPFETVDAHVGVLRDVLERANFDQLVYLSSTRVYDGCETTEEDQALSVRPGSPDHLYNLSKLLGESLALSCGKACRVVRLSNVVGPDMGSTNFLGAVLKEARDTGAVHFNTSLESSKDYIGIDDAVQGLMAIALQGKHTIYNLASGSNLSHAEVAHWLERQQILTSVGQQASTTTFPAIQIDRLVLDTAFTPVRMDAVMLDSLLPQPSHAIVTTEMHP
jgi:nucleoside-diphosphate-sugar epimerase